MNSKYHFWTVVLLSAAFQLTSASANYKFTLNEIGTVTKTIQVDNNYFATVTYPTGQVTEQIKESRFESLKEGSLTSRQIWNPQYPTVFIIIHYIVFYLTALILCLAILMYLA